MDKVFTTYQIAAMLNVDITTVINWINDGRLAAYKTPGGHRRVNISNLIRFLRKYKMPIPEDFADDERKFAPAKKILIVDDDKEVIEYIGRVIERYFSEVKVEFAMNGFLAGEKIAAFKLDLIILDIKLPGIDGFEVMKRLKKGKKMKILAITGYPSAEVKSKILDAGAIEYLVKPFAPKEISEKIRNLLQLKKRNSGNK